MTEYNYPSLTFLLF